VTKFIAYYRVSTKKQERSGLGLDAQQSAVSEYVRREGGRLIDSYRETESGRVSSRPELTKAVAHARRAGATLVTAKLDRLSRDLAFLSAFMKNGVSFVSCDFPQANVFMLQVMGAVAEYEAKLIRERTSAALAARKARGLPLGSHIPACRNNLRGKAAARGRKLGASAMRAKATEAYADLLPIIESYRDQGKSFEWIAHKLNRRHTTRTDKPFTPMTVHRILGRASRKRALPLLFAQARL